MIISSSTDEGYVIKLSDGTHVSYADVPAKSGGEYKYQRPGDILTSSFVACMNMTTQRLLKERNLKYDKVVIEADFDWDETEENQLNFYYKLDIQGEISEQEKEEVKKAAKECTVCQYFRAKKVLIEVDQL